MTRQQEAKVNFSAATFAFNANRRRLTPNLPRRYLIAIAGPRENYIKYGVPLYEASIKCDWKAAEDIIGKKPELVRYSLTENGETALHVAASVKRNKHAKKFVENLVQMMTVEDLELENENFSTAFYLASAAGNVEIVKIMVERNRRLLQIPGAVGMFPLSAAALFGHYQVVKYLYENSNELCDDDVWNNQNRGWLLEKCVQGDMFDIALKILEKHRQLDRWGILGILAGKPDVFFETKSNIIKRSFYSTFAFIGLKVGAPERENALSLLRFIWEDIAKKPKSEIDKILRGPRDSIEPWEKVDSERVIQALQLQKLINEHLHKLEVETENVIKVPPNTIQHDIESVTGQFDQAQQLEKLISEFLVSMHVETQNIIKKDSQLISGVTGEAPELQNLILKHTFNMHVETQKIIHSAFGKTDKLQRLISQTIKEMRAKTKLKKIYIKETYSSRVLFIAAEMGNTVFLVELIRRYPDLIRKVDDNGQSIFHIAVKHRHEGIYNLLYEIGSMKDLVTPLKDTNKNNMLHLVGKMSSEKTLENVSGAALRMQRELLWFKEVRSMVPPSYAEKKNKDGVTPQELFSKEHKMLVTEGEKWMKETASQCMVVATLIATIVFAAAFTIPGGYNQIDGIPIFYRKPIFVAFVVADAMSLFLSSTSILTFLSILTSCYAERDFVESLPKKLMLGVLTLFLSITSMMITFGVSFFILYHKEMEWMPILISMAALIPIVLYVWLQYHVLIDVIRSIYGSKYLFKPGKQFLYYVNPKV